MCSKGKNEENEKEAHRVRIFDMCVHMCLCACRCIVCVHVYMCTDVCARVCEMDSNREFSKEEMRMTRNILQSVPYR